MKEFEKFLKENTLNYKTNEKYKDFVCDFLSADDKETGDVITKNGLELREYVENIYDSFGDLSAQRLTYATTESSKYDEHIVVFQKLVRMRTSDEHIIYYYPLVSNDIFDNALQFLRTSHFVKVIKKSWTKRFYNGNDYLKISYKDVFDDYVCEDESIIYDKDNNVVLAKDSEDKISWRNHFETEDDAKPFIKELKNKGYIISI